MKPTIINGTAYLDLPQVAERLGFTYPTVRKYVHERIIPSIKWGRKRMVEEDYVKDMEGRAVLKKSYPRR